MNLKLKIAVASALDKTGIISAIRNYRSTRAGIVLTFHRVLPAQEAEESFEPLITLTDRVFEQLLLLLCREFDVVSLPQLLEQPEGVGHRQRVAISFDDGWADTYSHAYPLLQKHGVPATVFICPGLMAGEGKVLPEERFARIWQWCVKQGYLKFLLRDLRTWGLDGEVSLTRQIWSHRAKRLALNAKLLMLSHLETTYGVPECKERKFLTWDEVKIMRRGDVSFGSHTLNHSTLTAEQHPSLGEELRRSREMIEFRVQEEIRLIAYPNGAYDARVIEAARQAGYSHCFTTEPGNFSREANPFTIPRIGIDDSVVVNPRSSFHASRARFHLQHLVG